MFKNILLKSKESAFSILPVFLLVIILNFTPWLDLSGRDILIFVITTLILLIGMSLFNLGADIAMTPMGKNTGAGLTKKGKIGMLLLICFILGFLITIAEPDLSVLAEQTKAVFNPWLLILLIGLGVGIFLIVAILKTIHRKQLRQILSFSYMLVFAIALLVVLQGKKEIIALAFDSGGVTTGPITVPFLMALGLGVSSIISKKRDKDASFGLVALCSVGPVIITLILSLFSNGVLTYKVSDYSLSDNFFISFLLILLNKLKDVLISLSLISVCFLICNFIFFKLSKKKLSRIGLGLFYTLTGLVLFLSAAEAAYMSIGYKIGTQLASSSKILLVAIGFVIGSVTVLAEPAVHVLNEQVQDITAGLVNKKEMMISLTVGVGLAIALAMLRIIFRFNIVYYLIPGYILCLGLSLIVPKIYSSIAFDSGGVASGPLTSTFILPIAIGACFTLNGEEAVLTDAFGVVSLVALAPILTIELLGLIAIIKDKLKSRRIVREALKEDDEILIEFM